ncbi:MAG: metal-dependent hydrolase [Rubrivivax sp.]|nr:metal-dependent hydrolase [Rubrivivax sp.]
MTELVVRRLDIDLDTPPGRHWAGDAFRTAFFDALSFSFPAGEQLFIDAVRLGAGRLPEAERARLDAEIRGFVGQEATHRRIHERFNAHLERRGLVNGWQRRILHRRRRLEGLDARQWVGVTAATEHLTAVFADWLLSHPAHLAASEPRWQALWLWHASEESEHRSTAFDLYRAIGGNESWRRRLFRIVSLHFAGDLALQVASNLWRDGSWWRPSTWAGCARLLFGRDGLVRECAGPWRRYLDSGFHPSQADGDAAARWLDAHVGLARPVRDVASPG